MFAICEECIKADGPEAKQLPQNLFFLQRRILFLQSSFRRIFFFCKAASAEGQLLDRSSSNCSDAARTSPPHQSAGAPDLNEAANEEVKSAGGHGSEQPNHNYNSTKFLTKMNQQAAAEARQAQQVEHAVRARMMQAFADEALQLEMAMVARPPRLPQQRDAALRGKEADTETIAGWHQQHGTEHSPDEKLKPHHRRRVTAAAVPSSVTFSPLLRGTGGDADGWNEETVVREHASTQEWNVHASSSAPSVPPATGMAGDNTSDDTNQVTGLHPLLGPLSALSNAVTAGARAAGLGLRGGGKGEGGDRGLPPLLLSPPLTTSSLSPDIVGHTSPSRVSEGLEEVLRAFYLQHCPGRASSAKDVAAMYANDLGSLNKALTAKYGHSLATMEFSRPTLPLDGGSTAATQQTVQVTTRKSDAWGGGGTEVASAQASTQHTDLRDLADVFRNSPTPPPQSADPVLIVQTEERIYSIERPSNLALPVLAHSVATAVPGSVQKVRHTLACAQAYTAKSIGPGDMGNPSAGAGWSFSSLLPSGLSSEVQPGNGERRALGWVEGEGVGTRKPAKDIQGFGASHAHDASIKTLGSAARAPLLPAGRRGAGGKTVMSQTPRTIAGLEAKAATDDALTANRLIAPNCLRHPTAYPCACIHAHPLL